MVKKAIERYRSIPLHVRASIWFLICAFLQKGISVISTPIFTRILSTAEYGQYSVFNSWLNIISVFVSLNLYSGVYLQGLVKFSDRKREFSSSLQGLCLTLALGWTCVYLPFHSFWNRIFALTTVQMLAMLIMIWTTAAYHFWASEQRTDVKYKCLVLITVAVSVAKPSVSIFFIFHAQDKVTAWILGIALTELIAYTGLFIAQMHRGKRFFSKKFWTYAIIFNLPLVPHYISMHVLSGADRIMIDRMIGSREAGIYNLAYSISQVMTLFNTALLQTIEPWLYKKIGAKQIGDISKVAYPTFLAIAGVNLALIAFAPEAVAIFAPKEYYDAIWVIPPVAMSVFFMFAYSFFAVFEFYYEKTKLIMIATVTAAVFNIILNYIFIGIFGYYAAGYTTLACYIIYTLFHYCFMRRICRDSLINQQPYNAKILLLITAVFMIAGFLMLLTYRNLILRYALIIITFVLLAIKRKSIEKQIRMLINIRRTDKQA